MSEQTLRDMKKPLRFPATVVKQGTKRIIIIPTKYHSEIEDMLQKDVIVEIRPFDEE